MDKNQQRKQEEPDKAPGNNADWQGVDKLPADEKGKQEKVTKDDIKGKKVDADPSKESDKPA